MFQDKSATAVWVVENGTVRLTPVQVGSSSDNDILLASGVVPGQTIVTAGVNQLKPGQKVTILEEATATRAPALEPIVIKAANVASTTNTTNATNATNATNVGASR